MDGKYEWFSDHRLYCREGLILKRKILFDFLNRHHGEGGGSDNFNWLDRFKNYIFFSFTNNSVAFVGVYTAAQSSGFASCSTVVSVAAILNIWILKFWPRLFGLYREISDWGFLVFKPTFLVLIGLDVLKPKSEISRYRPNKQGQ